MIKNMIQEIINFLNTYIKAHGCTEMNKWVEFLEHLGWHPASELPPVGENGNSTDVIAIDEDNEPIKVSYSKFYNCWVLDGATDETFEKIKIKRWCYPPEEE